MKKKKRSILFGCIFLVLKLFFPYPTVKMKSKLA